MFPLPVLTGRGPSRRHVFDMMGEGRLLALMFVPPLTPTLSPLRL